MGQDKPRNGYSVKIITGYGNIDRKTIPGVCRVVEYLGCIPSFALIIFHILVFLHLLY